jgi:hypothetical protein
MTGRHQDSIRRQGTGVGEGQRRRRGDEPPAGPRGPGVPAESRAGRTPGRQGPAPSGPFASRDPNLRPFAGFEPERSGAFGPPGGSRAGGEGREWRGQAW